MEPRIKTLFICTANACRSQMAEALLRHYHGEKFDAFSAGSHPVGFIHPLAAHAMQVLGVSMSEQRSKSWYEFRDQPMDLVITVCDHAASETCPVWPGGPAAVNWPLPDPVAVEGPDEQMQETAVLVAKRIMTKLGRLAKLDFRSTPRDVLLRSLESIADA